MENNNLSYAEQLRKVYEALTPETWRKGKYLTYQNGKFCFCLHGAAISIFDHKIKSDFIAAGDSISLGGSLSGTAASIAHNISGSYFDKWKARQAHYKRYKHLNSSYSDIHYLLGMFGLTISFNDHSLTTLNMIKEKLLEAIKWSEENEEFLRNN